MGASSPPASGEPVPAVRIAAAILKEPAMRLGRPFPPLFALSLALAVSVFAPPAGADQSAVDLKISRVALFSSGVGYFEREGTVRDHATAEMNFRTAQINDIIKSLVVQDFGGGRVGVVSYASHDPLEKTLRSFGVDLTGKPTLAQLLDQLRGEPVELSGGRSMAGTVLGVEKHKKVVENAIVEIDVLNLVTDSGMQQVPLGEVGGVRLLNDSVNEELNKALAALARAHDAEKKSVTLRFEGQGERRVRAAYLLEAPIWKTTYRMVLGPEKKPFLQGWATVENATETDWNDVQLSLVSGRPISFVMDLYTPIYIPRPKVELELYASLRPPEYAAGRGVPTPPTAARPVPAADAEKLRSLGYVGGLDEGGAGGGLIEAQITRDRRRLGMDLADSGVASVATARDAGELFEYVIDTPVSIPRQHSAMLPIVNQEIEAEKVSIFNPATHPKHPLNGLHLTNTTALNLMQGPITVFEDNVYAGDARLPDVRPGEKRFISYALDLSTEVAVERQPRPSQIVSMRIAKGVLVHRNRHEDTRKYVVTNKDPRPRQVIIEQEYDESWKLVEPDEPFEKAPGLLRFKLPVPESGQKELTVRLAYEGDQTVILSATALDRIEFFLRARVISPAVRAALERVVELRTAAGRAAAERENVERDLNETRQEQARVRENLGRLDRNTDAYRRQLAKFDELETQIERLSARVAELREVENRTKQEVEDYLLSLDVE